MPLYTVLDPKGVLLMTPAAQQLMAPGTVVYLDPPPSAPISAAASPAAYPGYGPPARPADPGYVKFSLAAQFTAAALAAGRIQPAPAGATATAGPSEQPGTYLGTCLPSGSVPSPAPPSGTVNRLLYRQLNGQPGLKIAVRT